MEGVAEQSCMKGTIDIGWESLSVDLKSFKFKLSKRTHIDLSGLWSVALRSWPGALAHWILASLSNPTLGIFCFFLNIYSLFQLDTSVAATPLPHNVYILLTFSLGMFLLFHVLKKPDYFPRSTSSAHFSEKPLWSEVDLRIWNLQFNTVIY